MWGAIVVAVFLGLVAAGCDHPRIDATNAAAEAAWKELAHAYLAEASAARDLAEQIKMYLPAEQIVARSLEEASKGLRDTDYEHLDTTSAAPFQNLDRWHRIVVAQARLLETYRQKYPLLSEEETFAAIIQRIGDACRDTDAAIERYREAAIAYNRALRTFPESVVNNMFLKRKPRAILRIDRGANAVRRP